MDKLFFKINTVTLVGIDLEKFDASNFFRKYDYYETFDPGKVYTNDIFECDYGRGIKKYRYNGYKISGSKYFVVVHEYMLRCEQEYIERYCQCKSCTAKWYDFNYVLPITSGAGCLKSFAYSDETINKTRAYMINKNIKLFYVSLDMIDAMFEEHIKNVQPIRICSRDRCENKDRSVCLCAKINFRDALSKKDVDNFLSQSK